MGDIGQRILEARYFKRDHKGNVIEDWEGLCKRVVRHVLRAEKDDIKFFKPFFEMMYNKQFLPNSPVLRNFGANDGCGSACFVLPLEDSREGIFNCLRDAVIVQAFGGGTGYNFSVLRPRGSLISTTQGKASGPIPFMEIFDLAIGNVIAQGGVRKGAQMGILNVDHPDIFDFINAKKSENSLTAFNISVGITDDFMNALFSGDKIDLVFNGNVFRKVPAEELWNNIVRNAWENGEPGVVFLDTINRYNPLVGSLGPITTTNPCGEQPLYCGKVNGELFAESCNLGSINISKFVENGEINYSKLEKIVKLAVRFLDDVITINNYPVDYIKRGTLATRKIGLGIMGFADALIKMRIVYGSKASYEVAEKLMRFIDVVSKDESIGLAHSRGAFDLYDSTRYISCLAKKMELYEEYKNIYDGLLKYGIRNATTTTVAPTGTLSLIADCSSGIEPNFAATYESKRLDTVLVHKHPLAFDEELSKYFITSDEVSPEDHVRMQSAFQTFVDNAVSKTINMAHDATIEDVDAAFRLAYNLGCKGLTIYRKGSRSKEVMSDEKSKKYNRSLRGYVIDRPQLCSGATSETATACGTLYVTYNFFDNVPCEVFVTSKGGCTANYEALGSIISVALRGGISHEEIIKRLRRVRCSACAFAKGKGLPVKVNSCAHGIAMLMEEIYNELNGIADDQSESNIPRCPECGAELMIIEGCNVCTCGYSKCF